MAKSNKPIDSSSASNLQVSPSSVNPADSQTPLEERTISDLSQEISDKNNARRTVQHTISLQYTHFQSLRDRILNPATSTTAKKEILLQLIQGISTLGDQLHAYFQFVDGMVSTYHTALRKVRDARDRLREENNALDIRVSQEEVRHQHELAQLTQKYETKLTEKDKTLAQAHDTTAQLQETLYQAREQGAEALSEAQANHARTLLTQVSTLRATLDERTSVHAREHAQLEDQLAGTQTRLDTTQQQLTVVSDQLRAFYTSAEEAALIFGIDVRDPEGNYRAPDVIIKDLEQKYADFQETRKLEIAGLTVQIQSGKAFETLIKTEVSGIKDNLDGLFDETNSHQ